MAGPRLPVVRADRENGPLTTDNRQLTMQDVLTAAIEMHRSGQVIPGVPIVPEGAAVREQGNAEANLHLLGVLHHQQGQHRSRRARADQSGGDLAAQFSYLPRQPCGGVSGARRFRSAPSDVPPHRRWPIWQDYRGSPLQPPGAALRRGLGQHAESVEQLGRAVELRPDFVVAHNNLGIGLRELGRKDEALDPASNARVELDPAFAPAQTNLGQILLDLGRAGTMPGCRTLKRRSAWTPIQPFCTTISATPLRALDRLVDAKVSYLEALRRLNPKLGAANAHLGLVIQRDGQPSDGLIWLKKAVELEPEKADFWQWLAELYEEMEEPGASIPCWERVLSLEPDRVGAAHLLLGMGCTRGRGA